VTDSLLAYYYDLETKYKLEQDSIGNFKLDFASTKLQEQDSLTIPRAGKDSVYRSIYVKNQHHYPMELRPVTIDKDLRITEWPEFLEPQQVGKVTLSFSPSADRIKPLEGGSWDFELIVYPNIQK